MLSESPSNAATLETALALYRQGVRLMPLIGKRAIIKDWPSLHLGMSDIRAWNARRVNWGIITGEPLVVLDTDSEAAEAWIKENSIESPVVVRSSGRGYHRYFRCPENREVHSRSSVHKIGGLDVKGWRSYVVAAGSVHPETQKRYEYLLGKELTNVNDLPEFDPAWIREIRTEPLVKPSRRSDAARLGSHIRDVRAYIRGIPSIQGQNGDKACFTVACLLVEAGFDFDTAVAELDVWNEQCAFPPWEPHELRRKLRYAFARVIGRRTDVLV